MKLLLIRHGKVDMEWKKSYTSAEYDKACRQYDEADIVPIGQPQDTGDYKRIYTSSQKRAVQTARQLFPSAPEEMITQTLQRNYAGYGGTFLYGRAASENAENV